MRHGDVWAVVRRGESLKAGGRAVAVTRTLVGSAESFALTVAALGREEIPIFGRALMRRIARG